MKKYLRQPRQGGFAVVEALLVVIIIAAVIGVGYYVLHQKKQATKLVSQGSTSNAASAPVTGTTASVDQLTQQESQSETAASNSADSQLEANANNAASNTSGVGGAYNEANY